MVELEPGLWIQAAHVSLVKNITGQVMIVLNCGHTVYINGMTAEEVLTKLHLITEWVHPPGQRPPE